MKLAVFDIDGTLTRPYPGEDAAFVEGLERAFGFEDVDVDWGGYPHVTDTGIVQHLFATRRGRSASVSELSDFQEHYSRAFLTRAGPRDGEAIPGAARFLEVLDTMAGWCVSIATGNYRLMATLKLERAGIPLGFPMATADDSVSRADLVRLAVRRAELREGIPSFQHAVSIGDALWDLRTARELQVPFVAVGSKCGHPSTGAGVIADYQDPDATLQALAESVCW